MPNADLPRLRDTPCARCGAVYEAHTWLVEDIRLCPTATFAVDVSAPASLTSREQRLMDAQAEAYARLEQQTNRVANERDAALALLRDLEWASTSLDGADQCPSCGREQSEGVGHTDTCRLARILESAR